MAYAPHPNDPPPEMYTISLLVITSVLVGAAVGAMLSDLIGVGNLILR